MPSLPASLLPLSKLLQIDHLITRFNIFPVIDVSLTELHSVDSITLHPFFTHLYFTFF